MRAGKTEKGWAVEGRPRARAKRSARTPVPNVDRVRKTAPNALGHPRPILHGDRRPFRAVTPNG